MNGTRQEEVMQLRKLVQGSTTVKNTDSGFKLPMSMSLLRYCALVTLGKLLCLSILVSSSKPHSVFVSIKRDKRCKLLKFMTSTK